MSDETYQNPKPQRILDKRGAASARRILESGEVVNMAQIAATNQAIFGGILTEPRNPIFELNAALPLSALRDQTFLSGSATLEEDNPDGTYKLSHTTGGDSGHLLSQRRGRYLPGAGAFTGVGIYGEGSIADPSASAVWGYFDTLLGANDLQDGFLFGVDAGGTFIAIYDDEVEIEKWYQDEWNVPNELGDLDPLDGRARAYQVRFAYYGVGPVKFYVSDPVLGESLHLPHLVHVWRPPAGISIRNPNLKSGSRVFSTAGSDAFALYTLGRHYHAEGKFVPTTRVTSQSRTSVAVPSGTVVPIVSFRKKTTEKFRRVTLGPSGFGLLVTGNNPVRVQIRLGSDLTTGGVALADGDWVGVSETDQSETALETNLNADAVDIATGLKLYEVLAAAQQARGVALAGTEVLSELPDDSLITLCASGIGGSSTLSATLRITEEF